MDSLGPYRQRPKSRKALYLAATASSLMYVCTGCVMAWTSPAVAELSLPPDEAAWLGSLYALGAALGPSMNAVLLDRVGRKGVMYSLCCCFLVHWLLLGVTRLLPLMYLARVVGGLGVGGSFAGVSLYIAEISDEEVRGALGSMNQFFLSVGIMVQYSVGPWATSPALVGTSGAVVVASALALLPLPDSPHYLLASGRRPAARRALSWLRSRPPPFALQRELDSIQEGLDEEKRRGGGGWREVARGRALWVCLYMMAVQQLSGVDAIVGFTEELFQLAQLSLPPAYPPLLLGLVNLLASLFTPFLVNNFGLKRLMILSSTVMGLALLALAGYFFAIQYGSAASSSLDALPIVSLVVYNVFFCIGLGPVPWTIVGEMFPSHLKGRACLVIALEAWGLTFVVVRCYGWAVEEWGPALVVALFGLLVILGSAGLVPLLPDTRGLSLQDIQDLLHGSTVKEKSLED